MEELKLLFVKTHPDAILPKSNFPTDTGYDVCSVETIVIPAKGSAQVNVGLQFAYIPMGYWVRVESRSGLSFKSNILAHPGIIDSTYRGNAGVLLYNHGSVDYIVKKGDKIAQFAIYELNKMNVEFTEEVQSTDRGEKGFGSSGR
jgi:dUTP pyrophosphatase